MIIAMQALHYLRKIAFYTVFGLGSTVISLLLIPTGLLIFTIDICRHFVNHLMNLTVEDES
ncbi:MAG: hypothetical protein HFG41_10640 [Coprococcus sp.]|nr:hypothetical protein [Coprococcus sp.]